MREEILLNIFQLEVRFVQFTVAFIAKPQQTVRKAATLTNPFDHQTDTAFMTNGTVRCFRRNGHHIARTQMQFMRLTIDLYFNRDVAF